MVSWLLDGVGASVAGCFGDGEDGDQTGESDGDARESSDGETEAKDAGESDDTLTPTPEFDAVATAGGSWPMYGQGPQNSAAATDYSGPSSDCAKAWIRELRGPGTPILSDGRLYVRSDGASPSLR